MTKKQLAAVFVVATLGFGALFSGSPEAQNGPSAVAATQNLDAYDYEDLAVGGTAVGLTAAKLAPANAPSAKAVMFTVETAAIRYRYDGVADPTSAIGHQQAATDIPQYVRGINNLRRVKFIQVSGAATVRVTYLR